MFKLRNTPCTFNKTVYEEDKALFNCQSSINVYHCIQNERNRSGEICIQPVWVQPDYCPEYNTGANTLDTVPCNASSGCPNVLFLSNEVYKYPVCLNKTFTESEEISKGNTSSTAEVYIGIAVSLFILIALISIGILLFYFCRKGQKHKKDEEERLIDEEPFYKTSAYHEGVKFLNSGGKILCLKGRWGSGRTSTANKIYKDVTDSQPIIISDPLTFDVSEKSEPIIISQAFSFRKKCVEMEHFREKICIFFRNIPSSNKNSLVFIILILKENEDRKAIYKFFKSAVAQKTDIKFLDLSNNLRKGDRIQILYSQFQTSCYVDDFRKVEKLATKGNDNSLGYPEICALFCRCHFQTVGPVLFCNQPLRNLKSYLETMHQSNDRDKFLMLVYMSLNQMMIDVDNQNDKLFEILEFCSCVPKKQKEATKTTGEQFELTKTDVTEETSNTDLGRTSGKKKSIEHVRSLIPMEFIKKESRTSVYKLQHEVIQRMTLIVFGTHHFDKLLTLSDPGELVTWVKNKRLIDPQGDIEPVLKIKEEQWKQYQAMKNKK